MTIRAADSFIIGGGATANAPDVLAGKTISKSDGSILNGTMPNQTANGVVPTGVAKWGNNDLAVYPPEGYYKGGAGAGELRVSVAQLQSAEGALVSGNIKKNTAIYGIAGKSTVADCADCSVTTTGQMLSGITAYGSDGNKFTGTMPDLSNTTIAATATAAAGWVQRPSQDIMDVNFVAGATGKVSPNTVYQAGFVNLVPKYVQAGIHVGDTGTGITGTFTNDANATAAQILSGQSGYVNGAKVTGTMPNMGAYNSAVSFAVSGGTAYTRVPNGAYLTNTSSGYPEITATDAQIASAYGIVASNIKQGATIVGVAGSFSGAHSKSTLALGINTTTATINFSGLGFTPVFAVAMFTGGNVNNSTGGGGTPGAVLMGTCTTDTTNYTAAGAGPIYYTGSTANSACSFSTAPSAGACAVTLTTGANNLYYNNGTMTVIVFG